jgi:hypothetical protein
MEAEVQLPEKDIISPDELLKRYLEESGDTEQTVASKIGMNHHTLNRWLSDNESPRREKESWPSPRSFSGARDTCKLSASVPAHPSSVWSVLPLLTGIRY